MEKNKRTGKGKVNLGRGKNIGEQENLGGEITVNMKNRTKGLDIVISNSDIDGNEDDDGDSGDENDN